MSRLLLTTALGATMVVAMGTSNAGAQQDSPQLEQQPPATDELRLKDQPSLRDRVEGNSIESQQLTHFFAGQLVAANRAQIALSEIAREHSTNADVKSLAATIIEDHAAFNDKLQKFAPQTTATPAASDPADSPTTRQPRDAETNSPTRESRVAKRPVIDPNPASDSQASANHLQGDARSTLMEISRIDQRAQSMHLAMSKQMLSNYEGQDFDMAYLGMQIARHAKMLAKLQALEGTGSSDFQQTVQQATSKLQQHLQQAKQLSQKLEDDRRRS